MMPVLEMVYWVVATVGQIDITFWLLGTVILAFAVGMVYRLIRGKGVK